MNYGRGFPFPHEDGIVKRRESWTSATPGKPILQGSDAIPSNMQGNQAGRENWMDLMGMYRNILQEAPDLNVAAQKSNPTGAMAQNGGNQNCKVGLDQNGGLWSSNEGMGQIECIQTYNMGMGQNGGNRNSNVDLGQNGSNRSCYMSVGQNGVIPSYNMGMHQIGGSQNFNMGLVQNGGNCNAGMGQIGGNPNCNMGLGQNGRNPNCNTAMVHNRRIMDCTVSMDPNGENRNCNAAMGQNQGNSNFPSQGNLSSNRYLSIDDPSNWSDALLAILGINESAAPVALNKSIQGLNRPLTPSLSTQVGCSYSQLESPKSMVRKHDQTTGSSQQSRGCNLQLLPVDGYSVPYRPSYNLNSPARSEVDATISIVSPLQFKPVTPDKRKPLEDRQVPQEVNSVYGSSSNERNEHEHNMVSLRSEENEGHCNEVLQNFVNSSSSAVSTTLQEHHILDEGNEQGFDLNKTPQQKTPKRRKHRPKVVIEGKPKRTPKPKPPENSIYNDTPTGKRKYVRKIGLKISETLKENCVGKESAEGPQDVGNRKYVRKKILKTPETQEAKTVEDVRIPAVEPAAKSCRRTLNFDLESTQNGEIQENTGFNQIERKQRSIAGFNLNFNPQDTELCTELNGVSGASAVQIRQQNGYIAGTSNLQNSTNQVLLRNSFLPEANVPTTSLANVKSQALNAIARIVTKRSAIPGHSVQLNEYSQVDRHAYGEGIGQIFFKADAASTDLDRATDPKLQINSQSFTKDMPNDDGKRGLKRRSIEQIYPHAIDVVHPPFVHQKLLKASIESDDGSNPLGRSCLETHKKKKTHDGFYANISTTSSGGAAGKDRPTQEERRGMNGVRANSSISQILSSCFGGNNISDKEINAGNVTTGNGYFHPMGTKQNIQKHHVSSEGQPIQRSQTSTQVHDFNSLTAMVTYHRPTTSLKETAGSDYLGEIWARHANVSEQPQPAKSSFSNQLLSGKDQTSQRRHNDAVEGHRILPTTRPKEAPRSDCLTEIRTCQANALEEKQTPNPCSLRQRGMDKMLENQYNSAVKGHQPSSTKARGTPKKLKSQVSIDEITYRLEELNICGDSKEQHQLVPYKGDNSIVLFEPKKRKTRPKVDLDPESDRLWKFLMGKEGSEGAEAIDKDKEKWWEEERAVFRGRADSFIARMHLVQGDRRFSRWKGSVVDSVIGVFLTQNVSDHLSSSAFMALAAKFPPQSTTIDETCCQTQVLVEEPDIQILEHCESIQYQGKIRRQPLFNHSSIVACESTEDRRYLNSGVSDAANKHNSITEEEILSQDSFDSFVLQTADEQRSSSGSNSEAEDQTTGCKPNKNPGPTSINLLHQEGVTFEGFYSHVNGRTLLTERSIHMHHQSEKQDCNRQNPRFIGTNNLQSSSGFTGSSNSNIHHMQESLTSFSNFHLKMTADSRKLGEQYGGMSGEESLSSSRSTGSAVTEAYHAVKQTYQQSEIRIPEAAPFVKYGFLGKHPTHQGSSQRGTEIGNSAYSMNNQQHQNSKILQLERAYVKEPIRPAEILFQRETDARKQGSESSKFRGTNAIAEERMPVVDRQKRFENTAAEENSKEQTYSSQVPRTAATNTVKTRKGKAEEEKKRAFDWDSLRKQVLLNGENRERSKDAVDSLNYEALRSADVKMISDAIRERGMNNMLAERMKDFLNRLVRDHGSIDLEWLRDVPPDKAKDYLLSIRGLGLKSVECVRLLTLHHLAFPVDTNVGRIAVRLGWVPLQPLPESLQLHLLELYPVLETIQKYLWPRLCKLDQPTLYELHYQMITFGKVFCTKSKPNCNACPMRAECRHFASAFASARLALPGSEEKGIVPSAVTMADDRIPKVEFKPLGLPPSESNSRSDAGFFNQRCEPIIEEPSTPESETTEILERDIEDAFYEDPDEIPTIKLNMEEFTMNLHNLMHDNMELQGDMSMALVALNPEAASIPIPKLKNVSRLRTEHQVYELPDSHPLLDRLDKRECDDPSPYLLAIWTPGETANSVQPPESTCQAQESGNLCNDNTCFSCNRTREANSQTVRGTILVPCRTAMRGSFPLNGTYFQVNEMFADHESSLNPIDVPRSWLWNLPRRTVFFGTSVSTIFKGLTTEEIQFCFWRGFVCVRGFDQQSRAPRPLMARLHFPASKLVKKKEGK